METYSKNEIIEILGKYAYVPSISKILDEDIKEKDGVARWTTEESTLYATPENIIEAVVDNIVSYITDVPDTDSIIEEINLLLSMERDGLILDDTVEEVINMLPLAIASDVTLKMGRDKSEVDVIEELLQWIDSIGAKKVSDVIVKNVKLSRWRSNNIGALISDIIYNKEIVKSIFERIPLIIDVDKTYRCKWVTEKKNIQCEITATVKIPKIWGWVLDIETYKELIATGESWSEARGKVDCWVDNIVEDAAYRGEKYKKYIKLIKEQPETKTEHFTIMF